MFLSRFTIPGDVKFAVSFGFNLFFLVSPESLSVLDTVEKKAVTNFSGGDAVGESWTEKLQKKVKHASEAQ